MPRPDRSFSRRSFLRFGLGGAVSCASMSGWLGALAADAARNPHRKRACILLWMNGGPSTIDLWDLKPGHPNGGPSKEIETAVPGIRISENLPKLAKRMKDLVLVRGMSTKEGDHGRATYLLRTGNLPQGAIEFPAFGSLISKELSPENPELPGFVSIAPARFVSLGAYSPGFLGPRYAPLIVGDGNVGFNAPGNNLDQALKVPDLALPERISRRQADDRVALLNDMEAEFLARRPGVVADSHRTAYGQAVRLMKSDAAKAFDLSEEKAELRDRYGRTLFGQGCLLARRLVERGVPFVEVTLAGGPNAPGGWDTHQNNFPQVKALCDILDPAWATLMEDLKERGLLETTTIVWMGEFGRTPKINPQKGRDHFPNAWSTVIGGGGINGGQVVGKTSKDGVEVEERKVLVPDLLSTVCHGLGIDPDKQNLSNVGRPIRIVAPGTKAVREALASAR